MTASVTDSPRYSSAVLRIFFSTSAETCGGASFSPFTSIQASPLSAGTILYGTIAMSFCTTGSVNLRPIRRFTANRVLLGLVTAWRLAAWPTRISPSANATMDGVVRSPSEFSMTFGSLPSMTATHELVVPRSIPMILPIGILQVQPREAVPRAVNTQ